MRVRRRGPADRVESVGYGRGGQRRGHTTTPENGGGVPDPAVCELGDLLWTTGDTKIASRRFVDVLAAIKATGYRTFPVDVVDRAGATLGDFVGLAIKDGDTEKDLYFSNGAQFWNFAATSRVVDALTQAGVTELSVTPA